MDARTITRTGARKKTAKGGTPHLFLVLQCDQPLRGGMRFDLAGASTVGIGRAEKLVCEADGRELRIGVPDPRMSSRHLRLERVLDGWVAEDQNSKNGTHVDGTSIRRVTLDDGALLEAGHTFFIFRHAVASAPESEATLIPSFAADLEKAALVAKSRLSILLQGETGTGKEVLAAHLHRVSGRPGPFVPVNCGALPATLVESELFGYRKGAFTGALEDRPGLVRSSDGGTLLLDEIGDLPLPAQAALLRVLQEEEVTPLSSTRAHKVDLRVIAATHRDLPVLAKEGKFRADLLARLSGFVARLPPLRERREDLGLLTAAILRKAGFETSLSVEAARALFSYAWPGNVRELEKSLQSAAVLSRGETIELEHLPDSVYTVNEPPDAPLAADEQKRKDELAAMLREHAGNVTQVARALGKARQQVQRWLRRYGLDPLSFRR
ncbi:MAG: sigma 54-interacting transcriptional regulator [Myxococcales bacterium]|nr:sigma 54-interacting transcriptional regulator [Myxococcales bacterium]